MNIFVINLKNRDDRRKNIIDIFDKQNIDKYSFIEAVNGNDLNDDIIKKCRSKLQKAIYREGQLGLSEIGCALSHLKIYKKILNKNLHGALIFEDDISFTRNIDIDSISEDILAFDENKPFILRLGGEIRSRKVKEYNINNRTIVYAKNNCLDAHAYYINKKAAKNLLAVLGDYPFIGIDMYKQFKHAVKVYNYKNEICIQDKKAFKSDIDEHRALRYKHVGKDFKWMKIYFQIRAQFFKKLFLPIYIRYKVKTYSLGLINPKNKF